MRIKSSTERGWLTHETDCTGQRYWLKEIQGQGWRGWGQRGRVLPEEKLDEGDVYCKVKDKVNA